MKNNRNINRNHHGNRCNIHVGYGICELFK